jgi:Ni/Co efflux regulator RcnB
MKRLVTAVLAAALLILTTACDPGSIAAGTVTSKGITRNTKNNTECHWIKVRHNDGSKSQGCIAIAQWKKVRKGDHWPGQ